MPAAKPDRRCSDHKLLMAWQGSDHNLQLVSLLLGPLCRGTRKDYLVLDAPLVVTAADAEVTLLAPVWVPGIRHLPILLPALHAPAHELHGMPTSHLSRHMVVDPPSII